MIPAGYEAATRGLARVDRADRGLLAVTGKDRVAWLNNLITNDIREVPVGAGVYTFATDRTGRILFDAQILMRDDAIWLETAREKTGPALEHLERHHITEEVTLVDCSRPGARWAVLGPKSPALVQTLGLDDLTALPPLHSVRLEIAGAEAVLFRHDFAGVLGAEIIAPDDGAARTVGAALASAGGNLEMVEASAEAVDVLRIEAGIPRIGRDILENTLPAETGQFDRAVSCRKGCYLGQEVIERMRTRGSLARRLVGLIFHEDVPPAGTVIEIEGAATGTVTSACVSPAVGGPIGLGYVPPAHAAPGTSITVRGGAAPITGAVAALPFRSP